MLEQDLGEGTIVYLKAVEVNPFVGNRSGAWTGVFSFLNLLALQDPLRAALGKMTCSWIYHSSTALYLSTLSLFTDTVLKHG